MNSILKKVIISLLIVSGVIFLISFAFIKTINWINYELEPKYDENGKLIYEDDRHTIASFGKRKEFDIWKNGSKGEVSWILFDRDKNKEIDRIRFFSRSSSTPYVYSLGEKGYTKLNYETGEITQSKNIKDFLEEDRPVFERLERINSEAQDEQEKFEVSWEWIIS